MLFSCSKEDEFIKNSEENENKYSSRSSNVKIDTIAASKELSLAIGRTLIKDPVLTKEITNLVQDFDDFGNFISISTLLKNQYLSPKYEQDRISELKFDFSKYQIDKFKSALNDELKERNFEYINLYEIGNGEINFEIISSLNLSLFFPYLENHNWESLNEFTVTYENESEDDDQEAFLIKKGVEKFESHRIKEDDQLFGFPTLAIIPLEPFYNYGVPLGPVQWDNNGYPIKVIIPNSPIQGTRTLLTKNYKPNKLAVNSVLETNIPKVRITGADWKRNLSSSLRISILRASSSLAINSNGTYTAVADSYYFYKEFSGRNCRKSQWVDVHWQWDPNWRAIEASQQIVVLNRRKNADTTTVSVNAKNSMNSQGQYTPEITTSVNHTSSEGKTINRGNREIDRDQALITIIDGAESHNETYHYNGINNSVRKIDRFQYFFQYYYTNLD